MRKRKRRNKERGAETIVSAPLSLVAPPGFEPRLKEPESSVLPLYYRAIVLREASALRKSPAELRHKISALFHHCKRRATFFSPYAPASLRKGAVRSIIMNAFNIKL